MPTKNSKLRNGSLTRPMDRNSKGFQDLKAQLASVVKEQSEKEKAKVELAGLRFMMEDYLDSPNKDIISVGFFLKTILQTLKIKQTKFADYLSIRPSNLSKLINGERSISCDTAIKISRAFNQPASLWLQIQAKNQLVQLEREGMNKYQKYSLDDLLIHS